MPYEIYYIKNSVNEKIYIGQTVAGIAKRWGQHKATVKNGRTKLCAAMRKHGVKNFSVHKICTCKNMEELNGAEEFLISCLNTVYGGYNILAGGLNFERPANVEKLAARAAALMCMPGSEDITLKKFKVLLCLVKGLLTFPDVEDNGRSDHSDVVSDEEWKQLTKMVLNKLFRGWPGERVDALYVIFKCLCYQKGITSHD